MLARLEVAGQPDIFFGSFYRHCNSDKSSLTSWFTNISQLTIGDKLSNIFLGGDFNLPSVNWDQGDHKSPAQYGAEVNQHTI